MAFSEKIREIKEVVKDLFSPEGDLTDIDDGGYTTDYPMENSAALNPIERPVFQDTNPLKTRANKLRVISQPKPGAYEVIVVEPKAYSESITIVDALKEKKTVILNLQLLDREQSQRIVDFLCGCTHALDGSQKKIGENVFIFTPSNVNISQEFLNSKISSDAMWTTKA